MFTDPSQIKEVIRQRGRGNTTLRVVHEQGECFVPQVGGNRHYKMLLEWLEHNEIKPPPPKINPMKSASDLAHTDLPNRATPPDEKIIWRYMSFEQFMSVLLKESLWFSRGNVLSRLDPYEGQLPDINLKYPADELLKKLFGDHLPSQDTEYFLESHRSNQELFRKSTLINCWNMFEHESYAMWKVYGKGLNSVAIKSDVGALRQAFGNYTDYEVIIAPIDYKDYSSEELDESNYFNLFTHKNMFYESENELRCLIQDDNDIMLFDENEPSIFTGDVETLSPGANVKVDLETLIKKVVIGPDSDKWFMDVVVRSLENARLEHIPVESSHLR